MREEEVETGDSSVSLSGMTIVVAKPSAAQVQKEIRVMRRSAAELRKSPEELRAFLRKHGFITKDNKLHKRYR